MISLNEGLRGYASRFASFLIEKMGEEASKIDHIILYGSVARGTSTEESDIDVFIDTEAELEERAKEILSEFYESRDFTLFKAKGIDNEISLKVGKLEEWEELHRSITSTGIVLWGPFKATGKPIGTEHMVIFYWDKVGRSRTSFLNKLYGFETKGEKREGLLEQWGGEKVGKSSVIIPIKYKDKMMELIREHKVHARNMEVFVAE